MTDLVEKLKQGRFRGTTKRNYYSACKTFNQFIIRLDVKPNNWEDRIILFVSYMVQHERKSSTIKSYVLAIRAMLMNVGYELNEDKFLLNSMTHVGKLVNNRVHTCFPIKKAMLKTLVRGLMDLFNDQLYLLRLYAAMFMTAYYGLFRVSEISAGEHPILVKDVHIGKNKKKLLFLLWHSKTHGEDSKPQTVKISSEPMSRKKAKPNASQICCPYMKIQNYLAIRPIAIDKLEPFFVFSNNEPVKPSQFRKVLKDVLKQEGFRFKLYDTHSFRVGRSVDLHEMGVSVESICKLGR